ncbi:hypothetical protein WJX84_007914, partial [Apatococcus fuscideae]
MDALQSSLARMGQRSFSTGRKWYVPAARPPTQAETDAWLEEESGHARPQQQDSRRHGVSPKSARQGSGFAMDANTGKLIPVGADLSQASAGGGGSDLLETPSMTARTSNHPQHHVDPPEAANPPEDEVRPASPNCKACQLIWTALGKRPGPDAGRQPGLPAASTGRKRARFVSQITPPSPAVGGSGPTPLSQAGFKRLVPGKGHQLTLLSLEVHADCRGTLLPDPRYDATRCIIMSVFDDNEDVPDGRTKCMPRRSCCWMPSPRPFVLWTPTSSWDLRFKRDPLAIWQTELLLWKEHPSFARCLEFLRCPPPPPPPPPPPIRARFLLSLQTL